LHPSTSAVARAAAGSPEIIDAPRGHDPKTEVQMGDAELRQHLEVDLPCIQDAFSWLVQQLPLIQLPGDSTAAGATTSAAVAAGDGASSSNSSVVLQQLTSQAEDLQQQIHQCQAALGSSDAAFHKHAGQLGAAMVSIGSALAAVLPSKHCCNHTGCSNLAWLSEAELVAGKACVCGR
jgi:hypothetical protein